MAEHRERESALHEEYFGHGRVTIIEPEQGWRMLDLKELCPSGALQVEDKHTFPPR